jgi:hypothetical protein
LPDAGGGARPEPGSVRLGEGLRTMWRERVLGLVTGATGVGQLGFGALPVVVAVVAVRQGKPAGAGLLLAAMTAGGLVGSLLWTMRPARSARAPESGPVLAALLGLSGVANGPLLGGLLVTRQRFAPATVRTQVFTLGAGFKTSSTATGSALAGLMAGWSTGSQLVLVAACPFVAALGGAAGLRLTRRRATGRAYSPTATSTASATGVEP